ncbi:MULTISPECIES: protein kilB [unclassified Streptomyces]|uniref:protein kilB n=1 Tax=unclassified Streptomyces TaxID=2593676 RepID=UPI00382051E8
MWQTLIAVLGTLAGVGITGTYQARATRTARAEDRRTAGLTAVTALVEALADHRRAMWAREDLRLTGQDWSEARTESHRTRSALTGPLLQVQLLMPSVARPARDAADAAYALRGHDDHTHLAASREVAIRTSDELVAAVGRHLAT